MGIYDILADTERRLKEELLRKYQINPDVIIWTGKIANSADEARKAKLALAQADINPDVILAITGPMHTRTARTVLKHEFPNSIVLVQSIGHWDHEVQPDHMISVQRSPWQWFFMNVLRELILHLPGGFEFIAQRHHQIAST